MGKAVNLLRRSPLALLIGMTVLETVRRKAWGNCLCRRDSAYRRVARIVSGILCSFILFLLSLICAVVV